jgi:hypothetical protein
LIANLHATISIGMELTIGAAVPVFETLPLLPADSLRTILPLLMLFVQPLLKSPVLCFPIVDKLLGVIEQIEQEDIREWAMIHR